MDYLDGNGVPFEHGAISIGGEGEGSGIKFLRGH
jgi:hypothetical protein